VLRDDGLAFIELLDSEAKKIRQTLEKPREKRLRIDFIKEGKILTYIYNPKSLAVICKKSKFRKYKIGFKNINGQRSLVVYLYK